jgi:hypothetical protein
MVPWWWNGCNFNPLVPSTPTPTSFLSPEQDWKYDRYKEVLHESARKRQRTMDTLVEVGGRTRDNLMLLNGDDKDDTRRFLDMIDGVAPSVQKPPEDQKLAALPPALPRPAKPIRKAKMTALRPMHLDPVDPPPPPSPPTPFPLFHPEVGSSKKPSKKRRAGY